MLPTLTSDPAGALPLHLVAADAYDAWLADAPEATRRWLSASGFRGRAGSASAIPASDGAVGSAVAVVGNAPDLWDAATVATALPAQTWRIEGGLAGLDETSLLTGWALTGYRYDRYRKEDAKPRAQLLTGPGAALRKADALYGAIAMARDLINTPASDLGPQELGEAVHRVAETHAAEFQAIVGEALLERNYPSIHAVGRASPRLPRLVELTWGDPSHPKLTLVGKGVCFDTGGLDIKTSAGMLLMKKDMGGAAIMLALARLVMTHALPVRLRLLVPAVENSIAGSAFRPGDILATRKGISVEIGNTDAEGRLILSDALTEASSENPALLLDAATLTGAARTALGPEIPALFSNDDAVANALIAAGERVADPVWRLPLHKPYRSMLNSSVADINNAGQSPFAGAITAALFLQEFVQNGTPWAHLDTFAWNQDGKPGRPKGGEATALRALWAMLEERFGG